MLPLQVYRPQKSSLLISLLLFLFAILLSLVVSSLWQGLSFSVSIYIAFALATIAFIQIELFHQIKQFIDSQHRGVLEFQEQRQASHYRQIEALFSLFSLLKFQHPLPPMRGWAISPDFALLLVQLIYQYKPKVVMEAGSGVSTVIIAQCLKQLGGGRIISLEHDKSYSELSSRLVKQHGLEEIVTIVHAPLIETAVEGETWLWYDTKSLNLLNSAVDLLVVDGPPGALQPLSRYPALPLLSHTFNKQAVIVLDDAARRDEKEIVRRWQQKFDGWVAEEVNCEKGAVVLKLQNP
jgi:predicted O-methyltransferase YrrM